MGVRQTSKIALAWDLIQHNVAKGDIASHVGVSRRTIIRWHQGVQEYESLEKFLDYYLSAKKGSRKKRIVDPILKRRIWGLREKHNDCCGQKIQYFLEKDYGVKPGIKTIYQILSEKYTLKTRWKKNKKRGTVPHAHKSREVIQMDTVDFGEVFAFTAVDTFSREADVLLRSGLEALDGKAFLITCMRRRFNNFSDTIQTDGGSEFKAEFRDTVLHYCNRHRYARPYKKNEQAYIESFNRSLRKECLGWSKYKKTDIVSLTTYVKKWLQYYHYTRPHIGLGMKPPLQEKV